MAGELLRFTDRPDKALRFPQRLREFHKPVEGAQLAPRTSAPAPEPVDWSANEVAASAGDKRDFEEAFADNVDDEAFDSLLGNLF
jgi:hypothetical protein